MLRCYKYGLMVLGAIAAKGVYESKTLEKLDAAAWASWVQAVGSVIAILVAVWVSERQNRQNTFRDYQKEEAQKHQILDTVCSVVRQCAGMIRTIPGQAFDVGTLELYMQTVPKAHFENLDRLLKEAPLYSLSNHDVVVSVLDMMEIIERTLRLLSAISTASHDQRIERWKDIAAHIEGVRFSAQEVIERLDKHHPKPQ